MSKPVNDRLRRWSAPWMVMLQQFLRSSSGKNNSAPYIRDAGNVQSVFNNFVIASIPCWLLGLWNVGYQSNSAMAQLELTELPGWRDFILGGLSIGYDPSNIIACFIHGFLYFLPIFLVVLLTAALWSSIFSLIRRRPVDEGLLAFAWLFTLFLPAGASLVPVILGVTFGMIMGKQVYGGSGHYLVNPAVLGLTFLWLAYPELVFGPGNWVPVPGFQPTSALQLATMGGSESLIASGLSWWDLFLGAKPGALGTTSVLGCLLGASYMIVTGTVSWRIICAALLGSLATVAIFNSLADDVIPLFGLSWSWHLLLGGLAFGTIFFATDPVAGATTNSGRWLFGAFVGALVIIIRMLNPAHEGAILSAVLLASLFSPILDFVVVELNIRRRRQRLAELDNG
ncbi:MAG: RnfABCDGE type electron transport complex subunit D [Pseudohongiellaceae bacterium]